MSGMTLPKTKPAPADAGRLGLIRWGGYFALCNAALIALISLLYLQYYTWPDATLARLYVPVMYLGHAMLLAGAPWLLLIVPLTLMLPIRRFIVPLSVGLAAAGLSLLLVDALLFARNQFHLNPLIAQILGWHTWGFAAIYLLFLLVAQSVLARWLWHRLARPPKYRIGTVLGGGLLGCLLLGQGLHAWADSNYFVPITSFSRYLPMFYPATAKRFFHRYGLVDLQQARSRELAKDLGAGDLGNESSGGLNYPLEPLRCDQQPSPLNVLVILLDSMRADMLANATAPHLMDFSEQEALVFANHYSGGNSSRAGVFSFFYGLPGTYWAAFESEQRGPVVMEEFKRRGYQFGIFSSFSLFAIDADRTSFAPVAGLRVASTESGKPGYLRDQKATRDWRNWLDQRDTTQPFFGFLFFSAVHSRSYPPDYPHQFRPPEDANEKQRDFARYRTAMHWADGLSHNLLVDLRQRDLLNSTVVVISADHGQEFNETGLGFSGHGTSFNPYQLHVPFLLHWPGHEPARIGRRTSHLDVAPTLLSEVLGCRNQPRDYASGNNLFSDQEWKYLIAGSYHEIALIEPDRVTISQRSSYFEVRDAISYRLLERPRLNAELMGRAMEETTRFLKSN